MKHTISVTCLLTLIGLTLAPATGFAHCQVPYGIYDDAARLEQMAEDATTIEKAIGQIKELAGNIDAQSANQMVRWVTTKETHASNIITIVTEYFLTQKVKPVAPGADGYEVYLQKLADHHAVMAAAMKCKQNADLQYVRALREALAGLGAHYENVHQH
ncbi:MAG: superoxide dismutase [Ni] [bacterium]